MQVGKHGLEGLFELGDVAVAVMEIVDNTDVSGVVLLPQDLADRSHVRGFASPAAMIV